MPIRFVIDASIARSAGRLDLGTNVSALACTRLLNQIRDLRHQAAFSTPLQEEWARHNSNGARYWLAQMIKRRQVVILDPHPNHADLRTRIKEISENGVRDLIEKDRHLLELALATDRWIATLDLTVRNHVQQRPGLALHLATLTWIGAEPERVPQQT